MSEYVAVSGMRWGVAQIWSKRALRIKGEIQKDERDVYLPSYERQWISGGKLSSKPTALMPGYLFFEHNGMPLKNARGLDIEGIIRVLGGEVHKAEYDRMRRACDLGQYDDVTPEIVNSEPTKLPRRRWKPSKKLRIRRRAARLAELAEGAMR